MMGRVGPIARKTRTVKVKKFVEFLNDNAHFELECEITATVFPGAPMWKNGPVEPSEVDYEDVVVVPRSHPIHTGTSFRPDQFTLLVRLSGELDFNMKDLDEAALTAADEAAERDRERDEAAIDRLIDERRDRELEEHGR